MELTGDVLIGASRPAVWAGLNDPEVLAHCIPGCEAMEVVSPTERTARVAVKVGPVRARFSGRVRMEDIRPEQGCVLHFDGSGGAAGMARGQSTIELTDEAGATRLRYTAQASIGGKLGQVGGRMIDAAAKQMADQFFAALDARLSGPPASVADPAGAAPVDAAPGMIAPAPASDTPTAPPSPVAPPAMTSHAPAARPRAPAVPAVASSEPQRVLWFALGALSTATGVTLGWLLFS